MDNRVLVLTGMHRSGTSLLTHWLHTCGLHVGDDLLEASIGNEDGHFEDKDFFNWHRTALTTQQQPDDGFIHHALTAVPEQQLQELKMLLDRKQSLHTQWGWKDPRTCLFLDVYRELLPEARYLVIWRNYQVVVSSLITRMYNLEEAAQERKGLLSRWIWNNIKGKRYKTQLCQQYSQEFLQIWITYNRAILAHVRQLPEDTYFIVAHAALPARDQVVFEYVCNNWGFQLEYHNFRQIYKEKLISPLLEIAPYVADHSLLTEAEQLQEQLTMMSAAV